MYYEEEIEIEGNLQGFEVEPFSEENDPMEELASLRVDMALRFSEYYDACENLELKGQSEEEYQSEIKRAKREICAVLKKMTPLLIAIGMND